MKSRSIGTLYHGVPDQGLMLGVECNGLSSRDLNEFLLRKMWSGNVVKYLKIIEIRSMGDDCAGERGLIAYRLNGTSVPLPTSESWTCPRHVPVPP